jgi:hypothetical protein
MTGYNGLYAHSKVVNMTDSMITSKYITHNYYLKSLMLH